MHHNTNKKLEKFEKAWDSSHTYAFSYDGHFRDCVSIDITRWYWCTWCKHPVIDYHWENRFSNAPCNICTKCGEMFLKRYRDYNDCTCEYLQ